MGYRIFMEILRWYGILKRAKSSKFYRIFFFARRVHISLGINATVSFFMDVYSADGIRVVKKECIGHVQK